MILHEEDGVKVFPRIVDEPEHTFKVDYGVLEPPSSVSGEREAIREVIRKTKHCVETTP